MEVSENNEEFETPVQKESRPLFDVDVKEDTFEDASDELVGSDAKKGTEPVVAGEVYGDEPDVSANNGVGGDDLVDQLEQLKAELEKSNGEKEFIVQQYKEEREAYGRELGNLRRQLNELVGPFDEAESVDGEEKRVSETPLRELINECSEFLKRASEERLKTEGTIRELNEILAVKDREIEDLNARATELSVSQNVVSQYAEVQQEIDVVTDRMLASLSMVVYQEGPFDISGWGKMVHIEKGTYLLIEKYNQILYEVDLLRQCLPEPDYNLRLQDDFGVVFAAVRNELQQLTRKEADLVDKLTFLENENRKVAGQLDEYKAMVEKTDAELQKLQKELEQEKMRSSSTKEKLSLAVTKGKALVQQRDSLKHSLADKTSELEKCLVEMQEKSSALEAAELRIEELIKSENLVVSLQETVSHRDGILEIFEEVLSQINIPEELQSIDIVQKYRWIVDEFNGLRGELFNKESLISSLQETIQEKDAVFEKFGEILSQTVSEELLEMDIFERFRWIVEDRNVIKEELVKSEASVVSLQEMLLQRNVLLENIEDILSQTSKSKEAEETSLPERIRCLVDENNVLNSVSLEYQSLKHCLLSIELPELVSPSDLESRVSWLRESFYRAKDEINTLEDEIAKTREAAHNEIDRLSASLSAEFQEKDYLRMELEDLTCKYRDIVEKEHQVSQEKDRMVKMLQEVSGFTIHDKEGVYQPSSDSAMLMDRCIEKLKEQSSSSFNSSGVDVELLERIQSFLYVRGSELMLCEELLEEDIVVRSDVNNLSNELKRASQELLALKEEKGLVKTELDNLSKELSVASQELLTLKEEKGLVRSEVDNLSNELSVASQDLLVLKEEKDTLQKDLERSEEKAALLREKLSMAVKKGKGLVQDRENLRQQLNEKNSEIEKLKLDLQQKESAVADCRDEIGRLSTDLERIPMLEADLAALKDRKDQLEQFLSESNSMLHRVIESIDGIVLPVDSVFDDPAEKVKWLATYLNECQESKLFAEQEVGNMKEAAEALANKFVEAQTTLKSLEDALLVAQNNLSQLVEEKREIELAKTNVEEELKEARSQTSKFAEVCASRSSLEDELSELKSNISALNNEKEEAQVSRAAAEAELEKVEEEITAQTSKLTEAYKVIKSLEDALSEAEKNLSQLAEEKREIELAKINVEEELKEACSQTSKVDEVELEKVEEEITTQTSKLTEAYKVIKSLEDALSEAENNLSQLAEEKREIELAKTNVEEELKEACSQTSKFDEVYASRNSLEVALSELKQNISLLNNEKEEVQVGRAAAETELEKVKEEITAQIHKLDEAHRVIKSLEDALSNAESNVALLTEQNNDAQIGRTNLEKEVQKLQDEAESLASKMEDALTTIKSLEDALLKAENNISVLEGEKKIAEQETSMLNAKLSACMDELAGTSGNLKSRSVELIGYLNDLQLLMKDASLLSIMKHFCGTKFENLKDMDLILNSIWGQFGEMGSEVLQSLPIVEEDSRMISLLSDDLHNILSLNMEDGEVNPANGEDISLNFKRTVKGFQLRNKTIADKFEDFSTIIDELVAALLKKLQATRDKCTFMFEHQESLKQKLKNMEMHKLEQESRITSLENDVNVLLSACRDATEELHLEVTNNLLEVCSVPEFEQFKHSVLEKLKDVNGDKSGDTVEHEQTLHSSKHQRAAELLLLASRKAYSQIKQFESTCNVAAATIEDLQNRLEETGQKSEMVMEERDLNQNRVSELESEIEVLQSSCSELRFKLQEYQGTENKLKERESELASLYTASQTKEQETEDSLLSASEVKILIEKLNEIEVPFAESEIGGTELSHSVHLKKLLNTISYVAELQHQINILTHDNEDLQSVLSRQTLEIEHLEDEVATSSQDSQKMKSELSELTLGLEKIIDLLGGKDFIGDQKSADVKGSLPVLEKLLMALQWESENSKAKSQELGTKLVESYKVVEELSNKVKLLEDSLQGRTAKPEVIQERSIFEAPSIPSGSEISEVEETGSVGTNSNSISPPGSSRVAAAHVRTMKKGSASSEHLALNIDLESAPLISEDTDEDKGHVFKSLNTSGLIPTQGKVLADRVDGIWVSGGRVLMSRPRARLSLIAYWLVIHLWLLGTIL